MPMRFFCTLFDRNYLFKGLVTLRSLAQNCPELRVFVLCMDDTTQSILEKLDLPYVTCIPLTNVESKALLAVKPLRGVAEYCWTLSPCVPWYVLENYPEVDFITYIDSDLMFTSSVEPLFEEIGDNSIAIIEHRFSPRLQDREVNGRFCVEWVSFRRDEEGLKCLARWREQCIEWCYYRLEDGKMGDQKYLDEWPSLYPACHILMHPGAGIAPWNYSQYVFTGKLDDQHNVLVDGHPLVFYHFHQFQLLANGQFDRLSSFYTEECAEPEEIYAGYERLLRLTISEARAVQPGFDHGLKPVSSVAARRLAQRYLPRFIRNLVKRFVRY